MHMRSSWSMMAYELDPVMAMVKQGGRRDVRGMMMSCTGWRR